MPCSMNMWMSCVFIWIRLPVDVLLQDWCLT
jgi:hypothetical protein